MVKQQEKIAEWARPSIQAIEDIQLAKLPKSPIPINFYNLADINFIGGRLQLFLSNWYKVTSNNDILNVIKGHKINFYAVPSPKDLSRPESKSVSERQVVQSLLKTRVIEKTDSEGVVSPTFFSNYFDNFKSLFT